MARAPSALLRQEDFPDLQSAGSLDRFFRLLNAFFSQTSAALNRQLTFGENMSASWKTVTITTDRSGAVPPGTSFTFDLPGGQKPKAVLLATATTKGGASASAYGPGWTEGNGKVNVESVGGLAASTQYDIMFLVIGG